MFQRPGGFGWLLCSAAHAVQVHVQGSVTTPGGSRRFGSFAGRFVLQPNNPNGGKQMMDNYDILTPDQLRMGAVKMRYELDNLYKVRDLPCAMC